MSKLNQFYDRYWVNFYGWSPSNVQLHPCEKRFLERYLRPGIRVVEYGSGDCSHYGNVIASSRVDYIGLDISEAAVSRCREKGFNAIVHDISQPAPFPDDSCHVVLCIEVLEHLFDPESTLRDIYRVLKPDGVALITVPNVVFLPNRLLFLLGFFNPGGSPSTSLRAPWKDPHIRFFSKKSVLKLLKGVGFVIDEFVGEFSLAYFPVIYRLPIRRIADFLSTPLRPLGYYWPSLFAFRFFIAAKKPHRK